MFENLAFASPWLLGFAVVLPVLWWLLRLLPPAPRKLVFPALSLLRGLATPEQTPARTPWWLLLLRLVIAALLILAFARPLFNPIPAAPGKGALLIAVDNDWAAARDWDARCDILRNLIRDAEHESRKVTFLPTVPPADGSPVSAVGPVDAASALVALDQLAPQPWSADWQQANEVVKKLERSADAVWLASGLGSVDAKIFYNTLEEKGGVRVIGHDAPIYLVQPPRVEGDGVFIAVLRAVTDVEAKLTVDALARDGTVLARLPVVFTPGAPRVLVPLTLPLDLRNKAARFEVEGQHTAASALVDSGWEERPVGLVGDAAELGQHSLLSSLFYIDRALKPYADLHVGSIADLAAQKMAVLILPDNAEPADAEIETLTNWVKQGGVLVRFGGARLGASEPGANQLLPVTLRTGDRALGGALSWATPQKLRDFPVGSPFHGLKVPDDVTVSRQLLAEPSADLAQNTWAALADGTPLVTAKSIGQGLSILFHVPARSDWSNLPLSGLFVDMLRRTIDLSHGGATANAAFDVLPPLRLLDGLGEERAPTSVAQPITAADFSLTQASPQHPPGLYGTSAYSRAFNLADGIGAPQALTGVPIQQPETARGEIEAQPYLLAAAFVLLLLDFFISLQRRGMLTWQRAGVAVLLFVMWSAPAHAATDEKTAVELTGQTMLGFVRTGDRETDRTVEAGLTGLANILQRRTSVEHMGVAGVDPASDDLAFFPLIYWPIVPNEAPLTPQAAAEVNRYLQHGGMILFDAMDADAASGAWLKRILAGVDMPPLVPIPEDHVLKRSFYLLDSFPGRSAGGDFWIEPGDISTHDGVASVLYGSNGWAAAWAVDANGTPLFPCTPGGEQQREYAYRFGINLVMYALTGNYKSDQMQAQALLEKLGK